MSSKILPLGNNSNNSSHLIQRDNVGPHDESHLLEHSHTFNEAGGRGRETGSARETRRIPRRTSQLPQRATARKNSTGYLLPKGTNRLSIFSPEGTKDSLHGTSAELNVGKSGVMPSRRARDPSPQRDTRTMLPPTKQASSLSSQRHRFDGAPIKIGTPKLASTRSGSRPDPSIVLKSRSRSSIEPLQMGVAQTEPRISADQANQRASGNASPDSNVPGAGSITSNSHHSGSDYISGLTSYKSESDPHLTGTSQSHGRSRSQQLSEVTVLPSVDVATRKVSTTHQYRPPFSTFQQHFSPKKASKGSIAPVLVQPKTTHDGSRELSSDDVHIQAELTQLHLLLHPAPEVQKQWERSAKKCLQSHFELLQRSHFQLKKLVQSRQACENNSALLAWCDALPGVKVAEKLQLLSHHVQEISALIESGGMYPGILNVFEVWLARACRIRASRDRPSDANGQDLEFIESIGDDWKIEVAGLEMKLNACSRKLKDVGKSQGNSTLAHFLLSFQRVVTKLLEELGMIRGIESDLMAQETSEIEAMIAQSAIDGDSNMSSIPTSYQGIWHAKI